MSSVDRSRPRGSASSMHAPSWDGIRRPPLCPGPRGGRSSRHVRSTVRRPLAAAPDHRDAFIASRQRRSPRQARRTGRLRDRRRPLHGSTRARSCSRVSSGRATVRPQGRAFPASHAATIPPGGRHPTPSSRERANLAGTEAALGSQIVVMTRLAQARAARKTKGGTLRHGFGWPARGA